mmetsp:Transcript_5951/g.12664  ORF Transcript_5951/g.12664 Transcript_5951/m.12664 type:complete len:223 (+) Transcript_5951:557-1225(+)
MNAIDGCAVRAGGAAPVPRPGRPPPSRLARGFIPMDEKMSSSGLDCFRLATGRTTGAATRGGASADVFRPRPAAEGALPKPDSAGLRGGGAGFRGGSACCALAAVCLMLMLRPCPCSCRAWDFFWSSESPLPKEEDRLAPGPSGLAPKEELEEVLWSRNFPLSSSLSSSQSQSPPSRSVSSIRSGWISVRDPRLASKPPEEERAPPPISSSSRALPTDRRTN